MLNYTFDELMTVAFIVCIIAGLFISVGLLLFGVNFAIRKSQISATLYEANPKLFYLIWVSKPDNGHGIFFKITKFGVWLHCELELPIRISSPK